MMMTTTWIPNSFGYTPRTLVPTFLPNYAPTFDYPPNYANIITRRQPKIIKWNYPPPGMMKLNTDGSSRGNPGPGGMGGVLRNEYGGWEFGYMGNIDHCTSLFAELSSIRMGLRLVHRLSYKNVLVETDCEVAVKMIINEKRSTSRNRGKDDRLDAMIHEIRFLLRETGSHICHIYREANSCADFLAKEE